IVRRDQAGQDVERGGLAGTVRPQQTHRLAPTDPQADVAQHGAAAILLADLEGRQLGDHATAACGGLHLLVALLGWQEVGRLQAHGCSLPPFSGVNTARTRSLRLPPDTVDRPVFRSMSSRLPRITFSPRVRTTSPVSCIVPATTS